MLMLLKDFVFFVHTSHNKEGKHNYCIFNNFSLFQFCLVSLDYALLISRIRILHWNNYGLGIKTKHSSIALFGKLKSSGGHIRLCIAFLYCLISVEYRMVYIPVFFLWPVKIHRYFLHAKD